MDRIDRCIAEAGQWEEGQGLDSEFCRPISPLKTGMHCLRQCGHSDFEVVAPDRNSRFL